MARTFLATSLMAASSATSTLAGAPHRHGLEVLGAHDGARAAAAGRPLLVVHDAGQQDLLLACLADTGDLDLLVAQFLADGFLCLVGIKAPQRRCVPDLGLAVVDPQVHRRVGHAFHDEAVVTGQLEVARPPPGRTGGQPHVGERRLGADLIASRGGERGRRPGAGHEDQLVVRSERVGVGRTPRRG